MYSRNDKVVAFENAERLMKEIRSCELYEVPADSHLIWIGKHAKDVWNKRLEFLS